MNGQFTSTDWAGIIGVIASILSLVSQYMKSQDKKNN